MPSQHYHPGRWEAGFAQNCRRFGELALSETRPAGLRKDRGVSERLSDRVNVLQTDIASGALDESLVLCAQGSLCVQQISRKANLGAHASCCGTASGGWLRINCLSARIHI